VRSQSGDDGSFRTTRLEGLIDALIEVERPVNDNQPPGTYLAMPKTLGLSGTTKIALVRRLVAVPVLLFLMEDEGGGSHLNISLCLW
jgi:hypothetical protein